MIDKNECKDCPNANSYKCDYCGVNMKNLFQKNKDMFVKVPVEFPKENMFPKMVILVMVNLFIQLTIKLMKVITVEVFNRLNLCKRKCLKMNLKVFLRVILLNMFLVQERNLLLRP